MSTVTGPYTIAAGGQVVIPQPQAGGQLSQLILDNLSTYILTVTIGASVFFQAPLVEQAYNIIDTTQPVTVGSIVQPGDTSASGQLAPTWHAIGEEQSGNWPIALSGPAEVAAATAAALLAQGVPNVITEKVIYTGVGPVTLDVSGYASLVIEPNIEVIFQFETLDGTNLGPADTCWVPTVIPVIAPKLNVTGVGSGNFSILGSNRTPAQPRPTGIGYSSDGALLAWSGNTVADTAQALTISQGNLFQGPAFALFRCSPAASLKGLWYCLVASSSSEIFLADTGECHTDAAGSLSVDKLCALPANITEIGFLPMTTTAGVLTSAYLTPNY